MATSIYMKWIKPLKRSEKVKLRKELEKRKKEEQLELKETNGWVSNGKGAQIRIDNNMWEYKI